MNICSGELRNGYVYCRIGNHGHQSIVFQAGGMRMALRPENLNFRRTVALKPFCDQQVHIVEKMDQIVQTLTRNILDHGDPTGRGDHHGVCTRLPMTITVFSLPIYIEAVMGMLYNPYVIASSFQLWDQSLDERGLAGFRLAHD